MATTRKKLKVKDGLDVSGTITTELEAGFVVADSSGDFQTVDLPATSYEHDQTAATDTWVINHNLGFHPNVTVVDSAGTAVETEIWYTNINTLEVRLSSTMSGKAYLS